MLSNISLVLDCEQNEANYSAIGSNCGLQSKNIYINKILVTVILVLTIWNLKFLKRRHNKYLEKFLNRSLPAVRWFPINLPIIEGFITLLKLRKSGVTFLDGFVEKLGNTFHLQFPLTKCIATADPKIVQKLLSSTNVGHLNHPKPMYDYFFTDYLKDGLAAADVGIWAPHRKAVSQAFTYKSFPTYLKFMNEGAINLVKTLCFEANKDGFVGNKYVKSFIDHQLVKIITEVIMGSETFDITDQERTEFHEGFKRGKNLTLERFLHPEQFFPFIWYFHPNKRALQRIIDVGTRFSTKMTENYRKRMSFANNKSQGTDDPDFDSNNGVKSSKCLIELLISAGLTNKAIADEIATILVAGHETIITSLDMLIFHLASNPEIQEKCRLEVDQLFNSNSRITTEGLTMDDLSDLKYVERCILEGLRITPTVPFTLRRLDAPLEIEKDRYIEAGHSIFIMIWALHRNPDVYPNPEVFDPDRFLPENVKTRHSQSFIPFLTGPRNCVGWKLALMETKVFIAFILRFFEMRTTDKLSDVKILFDATLKTERMYNVMFRKRINME